MKKIIVLLAFILPACDIDNDEINHYIDYFYTPKSISVDVYPTDKNTTNIDIYLRYNGESGRDITVKNNNNSDNEPYYKYYGDDYYYKRKLKKGELVSRLQVHACAFPIRAITITADTDIDELHKTEVCLNDLANLYHFTSYYKIIKNDFEYPETTVDKLCDCTPEDLCLVDYFIGMKIPTPNVTADTVTYTISIDFDKDPVTGEEISVEPVKVKVAYNTAE
ncbi:MAG: hypothetical protein J6Y82_04695 [Bacteroidales bacterium]|nr:hypothetical protein [Bacteroidales bacterium]